MAKDIISITNLSSFNSALDKIIKQNKDKHAAIIKKVSFDMLNMLQTITPHKTNRARAGWFNNVNATPSDWKPIKGKEWYTPRPFKGMSQIKYNSSVNITNNVEYIIPLEHGHSTQNRNMVNQSLSMANAELKSLVRKESNRVVR